MRLPDGMTIQQVDLDGPLDEVYAAYRAATGHRPGPVMSQRHYEWLMRRGDAGSRVEAWAAVEDGRIVGGLGLQYPLLDNTHLVVVFEAFVVPGHRRRGIGRALYEHTKERVRAEGRRLLVGETEKTGSGAAFIAAMGGQVVLPEARRTLDLRKADWPAIRAMLPRAEGYHVERFTGPAPEKLLADLAHLIGGMNDAPRGADIEEMRFDTDRMRAFEASIVPSGGDSYAMIARRTSDGAPAGYTRIYIEADRSDGWARQADTTVLAAHRGRRLGLLLKVANLLWLRECEPQVEQVVTWNATSNRHMLAINEAMGFELLDEWNTWQTDV
ncbi:GNAT family N-acetyltransferase [Nonomuraea sp. NPDC059023]|uniref:GNAT family N-acetyltransferase n=1 Tax=unclassified Nonomuraea TaxID=2593643 RepID=UPI003676D5BA